MVSVPGFFELSKQKGVKTPILDIIHGILFKEQPAKSIIDVFK